VFKPCSVIGVTVLLGACGASEPRQAPRGATEAARPPAGTEVYRVDPRQSELRLLVHRAGSMARFGHNHVIANRAVGGWINFAGNPSTASFSLTVPVADFVVDDARMRSEEGPDFSEEIPEDAKAGTRRNMLSAALLAADRYPTIVLTSVAVTQTAGMATATLALSVAGHWSTLIVPFTLDTSGGRISASGTIVLRQSAMGLTPFSVMLGALQVQDELTVKFKLIAVAP